MKDKNQVQLRKFPYPFKAALSLCSDIDATNDVDKFLEIQKFLNTKEMTSIGIGLGLEIGNSFLMSETLNTLSLCSSGDRYAKIVINLIHSGFVDTLHSFGEKASCRKDAINFINLLKKNDCYVKIWIDHARAPSNFGKYLNIGAGDIPGSGIYHADLTLKYGVRFVWRGQVSRVIGQGTPLKIISVLSIWNHDFPFRSMIAMIREIAKIILSICGSERYSMHWANNLIEVRSLGDGQKVFEFMRFNNHFGGRADAESLAYTIQSKVLNHLKKVNGYMIVYTHLGKNPSKSPLLPETTVQALRNLEEEFTNGEIYVTTTSKLLSYYVNHKFLNWTYAIKEEKNLAVHIHGIENPVSGFYIPMEKELSGITFYIPNNKHAEVFLKGKKVSCITTNPSDYTGWKSIMFPLQPLSYSKELQ